MPASADRKPVLVEDGSIKLTLITIVIAFVLTLVFRAFVAEAFLIPTGSMAPTLLGEHLRYRSPQTGHVWAANAAAVPTLPPDARALVRDPSSGLRIDVPVDGPRAGDRIFVLKFLGAVYSPRRWDVVVFKNPEAPEENYIKRLVGLPGEEVLLIDGDVFTRSSPDAPWTIARKPVRIQQSIWRRIYSSAWAPLDDAHHGAAWVSPWSGDGFAREGRVLLLQADGKAALAWDHERFPLDDGEPYNDAPVLTSGGEEWDEPTPSGGGGLPISDVRTSMALTPEAPLRVRGIIESPGRTFAGEVAFDVAVGAVMRILRRDEPSGEWRSLAEKSIPDIAVLRSGRPTRIEFAHADQRVELVINGRHRVSAAYEWDARERLTRAAGLTSEAVDELFGAERDARALSPLAPARVSASARVRWEFEAAGNDALRAVLERVSLDRDVHYRPALDDRGRPARATHPALPARLDPGQYFVLGDNSASSRDSRLWDRVDPWVSAMDGAEPGVVNSDLLIGKAFFVYFPAPLPADVLGQRHAIVPDVGRMRFIR